MLIGISRNCLTSVYPARVVDRCGALVISTGEMCILCASNSTQPMLRLSTEHVRPEDLTADTRMIAEVIGLEATVKLIDALGGTRLHIQSPQPLLDRVRREMALSLYDGTNEVEVCRATGLSVRQLRRVVRGDHRDTTPRNG